MGDFVAQKIPARPIDTTPQQLSLFDSEAFSGQVEPVEEQREAIANFSVYAAQPYSGELEGALSQWQEWLH